MMWIATKYLITAALVVAISEFAKRSDRFGAFIAALPIVTTLVLIWMHVEKQPHSKIGNHAYYTFWYVLPTLPMFLAFPYLLNRFGFWMALVMSAVMTIICFAGLALVVRRFGIQLL